MNTTQNATSNGTIDLLSVKISLAFIICLIGIVTINVFAYETQHWAISENINHLLRGGMFSTMVVVGIWLIRKKTNSQAIAIGYKSPIIALKTLGLGLGLILVPLLITLVATQIFGWAQVSINSNGSYLSAFFIGFCATFLTDALPEEVIFRDFVYSQLNTRYSKIASSLVSVLLFVLFPLAIVGIQKLLNYPVFIGGEDHITPSFIITMLFFGSFMQYLRVLTNSVWTSIGFHTLFVFMNMLIGTGDNNLIQLSGMSSQTPAQILLISLVVLIFAGLIAYPYLSKKPIGWKSIGG